jgi:putative DeoR family transcriptional regulator (stage III sporulation protein D)
MAKSKKQQIEERSIERGLLFIKRDVKTIRDLAKLIGANKSTVHLDLHRLEEIHPALFQKVKEKLDFNNAAKHIRGGEARKKKAERERK